MPYKRKTDEEIKQLAVDFIGGKIYTSYGLDPEEVVTVFTILSLSNKEYIEELKRDDITLFYEYLDRASPVCCNGRPMFLSCHLLNHEDQNRLAAKIEAIQQAISSV